MKRNTKIIAGGTALVLLAGGIAYASQEYKQYRTMHKLFSPKAMLEKVDANGDLAVSMDEIMTQVKQRFTKADADGDNKVTKAEIITGIESFGEMPRLQRHSGRIADRIMLQLDINEDGNLELSEMENRLGKFHSLADWDDDGAVEMSEVRKLRSLRMHHGKHGGRKWREHYRDNDSGEEGTTE